MPVELDALLNMLPRRGGVTAPMPQAMPLPAPQMAPMPALPTSPSPVRETGPNGPVRGKMPWGELMRALSPVIGGLAMGGNGPGATGFMQGFQHGAGLAAQEQAKRKQDHDAKQEQAAKFRMEVFNAAKEITDPSEWAKFVDMATDSAMQMGLIQEPSEFKRYLEYPAHLDAKHKRDAALARLESLIKSGYDLDQLAEQNASVQVPSGARRAMETYKVRDLITIAGALPEANGKFVAPPKVKPTAPSDREQSFARFLKDRGKTLDTATSQDEAEFAKFMKDATVDPEVAGLNKALKELQVDAAKTRAASGAQSTDLMNQLRQLQIDTAKDKKEAAATQEQQKRTSATKMADEMVAEIDKLLDPTTGKLTPGASAIVAARIPFASNVPGSKAADAKASLDRLTGQLIVDLMREMKEQSRTGATGFGALSERELSLLQGAASKLSNRNMSETAFAAELKRIRDKMQLVYGAVEQAVPAEVSTLLKSAKPGRHTLSDGSVWVKTEDGSVSRAK